MRNFVLILIIAIASTLANGQSGRKNRGYSEALFTLHTRQLPARQAERSGDSNEIRIETDLVIIPLQITSRGDSPAGNLQKNDFRIYENGQEQELAYLAGLDQPFTVILLIDISYSTVFKIADIQEAARAFVEQLSPGDRVGIIAFDQRPQILSRPTINRRATRIAIDSLRTGSGTSIYDAVDLAFRTIADFRGRKAIVMLTDGVDTTSQLTNARRLQEDLTEEDVIVYGIRYNTFSDIGQLRKRDAEIVYDKNDRPYILPKPPSKGEREADYLKARAFLKSLAEASGGRIFEAQKVRDLKRNFAEIADELRKTYVLGYYPSQGREPARDYTLRIRVLRPGLRINTNLPGRIRN